MSSSDEVAKAHKVIFDEGIKMRYKVAGKEYVDRALKNGMTPFASAMQEYVTESCWGSIWTRPGLELKTRSFLNMAMLCALNRSTELGVHAKGALNNGATEEELREVLLQAACYCGMPAGIEGFKVVSKVIEDFNKDKDQHELQHGRHGDVGIEQRMDEDEAVVAGGPAAAEQPQDSLKLSHQTSRHSDLGVEQRMDDI